VSIENPPEGEVPPRADLVSALLWMLFGAAVAVGAWRMDRLEHLHINKYEAPGLVPGILGATVLLLGLMLAVRAIKRGALRPVARPSRAGWGHMALVFAAMMTYSVVLVGHGLPFWFATGAFVAAFIFFFDRERQNALGRSTARQALLAVAYGTVLSAVVSLSFQEIFYVRLP
jgi:ABC-type Fe3+-siderophore transport system permease subunit